MYSSDDHLSITTGYSTHCDSIEQNMETFTKHKTRLQVVRETKERERLEILGKKHFDLILYFGPSMKFSQP